MITRKQYMAGDASHQDYFRDVISAMGGPERIPCPVDATRIAVALAAGDAHLNTIPLGKWDAYVGRLQRANDALKPRGDYLTLGTGVCILKEAARWRRELAAPE